MIREQEIMQSFPDRTEADLFIFGWLIIAEEFVESFPEEAE